MSQSLVRALSAQKRCFRSRFGILCGSIHLPSHSLTNNPIANFSGGAVASLNFIPGSLFNFGYINGVERPSFGLKHRGLMPCLPPPSIVQGVGKLCTIARDKEEETSPDSASFEVESVDLGTSSKNFAKVSATRKPKKKAPIPELVSFTKVDIDLLPTVIIVGRPNVGKSALFNRLIRRREALVYNTPEDHVTRDIREGVAKLGDLRFKVLDSAGLEMAATTGSILHRTAGMTANVIAKAQAALFLIDVRHGLHPLDLNVGKWLRKNASGLKIILVMNKAESLVDRHGSFIAAAGEAHNLGFGDPLAISAETGLGMVELYEALRPVLEEYMLQVIDDEGSVQSSSCEAEDPSLPLQLAIVGRPNVGKSTLLNALLEEERVLVGPEAGLTRDSIRVHFEFEGRTVYLVDTAGWLQSARDVKGPSCLGVMQSRKNLMRAQIIALVLDAEEITKGRKSMRHSEVLIARRAVEEGRGLVVVVNKMDLIKGKEYEQIIEAVPEEIQTYIPEVSGIPVVFVSALEGKGRFAMMREVFQTYDKWCLRLSTGRLNRWLRKVMSRHSWKDDATQPKIKYFTQVKARPPTFVAFTGSKVKLQDFELRFIMKSLKEDFDIGGIPIRIQQRAAPIRVRSTGNNRSRRKVFGRPRSSSEKRLIVQDS